MTLKHFTLATHVVRRGDGQGRVNLEVVREALRQSVHVTIVAREIAPDLERNPLVDWIKVPVRGIPSHLLREVVFSVRSAKAIRRAGKGPLLSNGCITSVPAQVNACHFVHTAWLDSPVHTSRLVGGARGLYQKFYSLYNSRQEKAAYTAAKTVVAVSEQVRQELSKIGIDPTKIVTVPNGVDSDEFHPGAPERARWQLPEGVPLALFAGDIRSPRKNLETVLRALLLAPGIHLAVAGDATDSPYPAMANELGVSDRVHFLGMVKEMPALMRSCDLFTFPSRYEACSLVMLEAMAAGLPVITARTTGGAELVPEKGGYLLENPGDVDALAAFLRTSLDETILKPMSSIARERALELRWDAMGDKYLKILESYAGRD